MWVHGLPFVVKFEAMSGLAQRIRNGVSRISAVEQDGLSSLPALERSLVPVLSLASTFYTFGIHVRRLLYQLGIFGRTRLPIPVISVGNLTWGGTGKTPMVEYLARHYLAACVSPLILSRDSTIQRPMDTSASIASCPQGYRGGDEVHLLQKHLQNTCTKFGVGSNRTKEALSILRHEAEQRCNGLASIIGWKAETGVAILDDGMQHWALERDLEIVMINSLTLWGNGRLVPRGPMRESLESIERAHVVVFHHSNLVGDDNLKFIKQTVYPFLRKGSIVLSSHMRPLCIYRYTKSRYLPSELPLLEVTGAVILCVSAVGCPESLDLVLLQIGASRVERLDFVDHHKFNYEDLKEIAEVFKQLQLKFPYQRVMLVTTEKDYVRDPAVMIELGNLGDGIFVLHSALEIIGCHGSEQAFRELLGSVCRQQKSKRMFPFCEHSMFIKCNS